MTLSRTWPSGIALHQESFSYEWNNLDTMVSRAVDKRGDTISGTIALSGAEFTISGMCRVAGGAFKCASNAVVLETFNSGTLDAGSVGSVQITGGATAVIFGAGSTCKTSAGGRIQLGDSDYITFSAARAFTKVIDLGALSLVAVNGTGWTPSTAGDGIIGPSPATSNATIVAIPPEQMPPNGALITRVDIYFTPKTTRTAVATNTWAFALQNRTIAAGSALPTRANVASGSMASGMYNTGVVQVFSLTGSPILTVDSTQSQYSVRIMDENGGGAVGGTVFHQIRLTYTMAQASFR